MQEEEHENTDRVKEIFEETVMGYSKKSVPIEDFNEETAAQHAIKIMARDLENMRVRVKYLEGRVIALDQHCLGYVKKK